MSSDKAPPSASSATSSSSSSSSVTSQPSPYTLHETKLHIPFPSASDPQSHLVGILAQHKPFPARSTPLSPESTQHVQEQQQQQQQPIALFLHGILAHKDQAYHRKLRDALPLDSFRFDFRANHESLGAGEWNMSNFSNDVEDLNCILDHLETQYGYKVALLVGHSRGSLIGWKWFADLSERMSQALGARLDLPLWVSLGGRWDMSRIHDRDALYAPHFQKQGYYLWKVKVAGQERQVKIFPEDVTTFERYPIRDLVSRFPAQVDCLLLHGTSDEIVPCPDLAYYTNALTSRVDRGPGQTQIHLVEGANHMFKDHHEEVVSVIAQWYRSRKGKGLTSIASSSSSSSTSTSSSPSEKEEEKSKKTGQELALEASHTEDVLERSWREKSRVEVQGGSHSSPSNRGKL